MNLPRWPSGFAEATPRSCSTPGSDAKRAEIGRTEGADRVCLLPMRTGAGCDNRCGRDECGLRSHMLQPPASYRVASFKTTRTHLRHADAQVDHRLEECQRLPTGACILLNCPVPTQGLLPLTTSADRCSESHQLQRCVKLPQVPGSKLCSTPTSTSGVCTRTRKGKPI